MSENYSDLKSGSIEKIDKCFYLKLSRSPNVNELPKMKEITGDVGNYKKKESLFEGDSIISNEEYKIMKINDNNLNSNKKNGNIFDISNSRNDMEINANKNIQNMIASSKIKSNNTNRFTRKSTNKSKISDDKGKNSKIMPVGKQIYKANDLDSEFSKDYKSIKEGIR